MEVRADKFMSGHYAYFVELPERNLEKKIKELVQPSPGRYLAEKQTNHKV
ncbi:MAG TPA: hypothetical protein VJ461_02545 [Candidatus Nanoarchaeia archaeon]|nr:hypothetical protein [Candidatus Nanoarchaeia archaeon]